MMMTCGCFGIMSQNLFSSDSWSVRSPYSIERSGPSVTDALAWYRVTVWYDETVVVVGLAVKLAV